MKHIRWKLQKSFKMSTIISYSRKFEREENNFDNWRKKRKFDERKEGEGKESKKQWKQPNEQTKQLKMKQKRQVHHYEDANSSLTSIRCS